MSGSRSAVPVARGAGLAEAPPEQPDTDEPDTDEPDTDELDTDELDTDELDTDELDTDEPDTDEPGPVGLPADSPGAATRAFAVWLVVAGLIGGFAAFMLTWDKVKLLENPNAHLVCNISPIVGCGKVILTKQASAFGFPNSFMGIAGFAVVATIGMALLSGASFRRWFWLGLQVGVVFGMGLVCWLIDQSIFHIHALCPYCMTVWSVMIPTFLVVTAYNLRSGHLGRPAVAAGRLLTRHVGEVLVLAYAVVVALAGVEFWTYWQTLL